MAQAKQAPATEHTLLEVVAQHGHRPAPEIGAPVTGCNIVVGVEDVDGLMAKAVELGATEALPASDWPGIGRGGYLIDPDGNVFGLISPVLSDGTRAM